MRYLIFGGTGIGDFVMLLPMAQKIKENDKNAFITYFNAADNYLFEKTKNLIHIQDVFDEVVHYSKKDGLQSFYMLLKLGFHKYDISFLQQYIDSDKASSWPYRICRFASKKICGVEFNNKNVKFDYTVKRIEHFRKSSYQDKMLEAAGINSSSITTKSVFNNTRLVSIISRVNIPNDWVTNGGIVLAVGAEPISIKSDGNTIYKEMKNWPLENWVVLANDLASKGNLVFLMGGRKEKEKFDALGLDIDKSVINGLGKYSIDESIAILSKSKIIVGADTGLMHCAGALGITSLTLFGCTDFNEYLPVGCNSYYISENMTCSPCFGTDKIIECHDNQCMKSITIEKVRDTIMTLI